MEKEKKEEGEEAKNRRSNGMEEGKEGGGNKEARIIKGRKKLRLVCRIHCSSGMCLLCTCRPWGCDIWTKDRQKFVSIHSRCRVTFGNR